jgi:hypothetical protein
MTLRTVRPLACIGLAACLMGQAAPPANPPRIIPGKPQVDAVTAQVNSGKPEELDAAIKQIREWLPGGGAPSNELCKLWLPAMLKAGRLEDVADISLQMVLIGPSASNIRDFYPLRISALHQLHRNEEALENAKSAYNGVDLKATAKAASVLAQCLAIVHPEDASLPRKFLATQAAAVVRPGSQGPPEAPDAGIFKSIKVDPKIYQQALATWEAKSAANTRDAEKYGNVLLLADEPEKAEKLFREILAKATTPADKQRYNEGIVRSIKAEDGNPRRAAALQPATPAASPKPADPGLP